jgi:glycosyltransferase involved in cell wall biosynthesis
LIVDGHNNSFEEPWISFPYYIDILSSSKMVMVHNDELEKYLKIKYRNISFYILPDKIPDFPLQNENIQNSQKTYFLAPLSFSPDEPLEELFDAITLFLDTVKFPMEFIITGNYIRKKEIYDKYRNVQGIRFLGYVDNPTYDNLLTNAFCVIALTKRQMTQQCAAVEAMGANVPLIVSDTDTNRRLFSQGAIITSIDRNSIKNSLEQFIRERGHLLDGITERKIFWNQQWDEAFIGLKNHLTLEGRRNPVPGSGTVEDPVHSKTTVEPVDR